MKAKISNALIKAIQQCKDHHDKTGENLPLIGGKFFIDGKWITFKRASLKIKEK